MNYEGPVIYLIRVLYELRFTTTSIHLVHYTYQYFTAATVVASKLAYHKASQTKRVL